MWRMLVLRGVFEMEWGWGVGGRVLVGVCLHRGSSRWTWCVLSAVLFCDA